LIYLVQIKMKGMKFLNAISTILSSSIKNIIFTAQEMIILIQLMEWRGSKWKSTINLVNLIQSH
jgi:hypothetical protein